MYLSPARFNAFLSKLGQRVGWRPSRACPCRNPYSGAAAQACPSCGGLGRIWDEAIECHAAPAGQKLQRAWADFGLWQSGDLVVTLASDQAIYALGEGDRVVLLDSSAPFSLVLAPGAKLRMTVLEFSRCTYLAAGVETDAALPDVADDGVLSWAGGGAPPAGAQFTLTGRRHPEYFAFQEFPQDRAHHHGADLPRRVVLRAWDLYGR